MSDQLERLREQLNQQRVVASRLGLDIERPVQSIDAGFPENAVTLVGKAVERILKELWEYFAVAGDPSGRGLNELIKGVQEHVSSPGVLQALKDIQGLRNRSSHDGYVVEEGDALVAVQRLVRVLEWLQASRTDLAGTPEISTDPGLESRIQFMVGLYDALAYRTFKRFDLTQSTTYLVFEQRSGIHVDYVEVMLGTSFLELCRVFEETGGELLQTTYPKSTRFVLVDDEIGSASPSFVDPAKVMGYQTFLDTIVNSRILAEMAGRHAKQRRRPEATEVLLLEGDLLVIDRATLSYSMRRFADLEGLILQRSAGSGNLLIIGGPGMGKSELITRLASMPAVDGRYRFYIDLSDRESEETFDDLVVRQLASAFLVQRRQVWSVFLYLIRSGRCVCLLDAIDEAVPGGSLDDIVRLFGELGVLMSASSSTILTSRQSFLLDSPYVRQLMHHDSLLSDKIASRLVSEGVDALSLPDFSVVRIVGLARRSGLSPLAAQLSADLGRGDLTLVELVAEFTAKACRDAGLDLTNVVAALGERCIMGVTTFSVLDVFRGLGQRAFRGGLPDAGETMLEAILLPVDSHRLRVRHKVFGEYLAAEFYLRNLDRPSLAGLAVSDQTREFIQHLGRSRLQNTRHRPVDVGNFLVGPPGELVVHRQPTGVVLAVRPVTAREYRRFLAHVEADGAESVQHPLQPEGETIFPMTERLIVPGLYNEEEQGDEMYGDHPATCVSWWGAWAYARWAGGRLPTSTEWELAARGQDGRLFPWGDDADWSRLNCADRWAGRVLSSWDEWKVAYDHGDLVNGAPIDTRLDELNVSPYGCMGMAGNVWEWTASCLESDASAVIAGGSYDNPIRGTRVFSRAAYRLGGRSNAVGFRLAFDREDPDA
jgi:hypothetical protein